MIIFTTNAWCASDLSMKSEIRAVLRQGKGSIVNISSAYRKVGGPTAAVYVGSKHAVEGITKSAASELAGTGVRVNIVGPGPVETGMFNRRHSQRNLTTLQLVGLRRGLASDVKALTCHWPTRDHQQLPQSEAGD